MNSYRYHPRELRQKVGDASRRRLVWQNVLVPVLAVALAISLAISIPAASSQSSTREMLVKKMSEECGSALNDVKYLSRTAASNSNAQLAKIRANIHAMEAMNELNQSLNGQYLVSPTVFSSLYTVLDAYYNQLGSGTSIIESLTNLTQQLTELQTTVTGLT